MGPTSLFCQNKKTLSPPPGPRFFWLENLSFAPFPIYTAAAWGFPHSFRSAMVKNPTWYGDPWGLPPPFHVFLVNTIHCLLSLTLYWFSLVFPTRQLGTLRGAVGSFLSLEELFPRGSPNPPNTNKNFFEALWSVQGLYGGETHSGFWGQAAIVFPRCCRGVLPWIFIYSIGVFFYPFPSRFYSRTLSLQPTVRICPTPNFGTHPFPGFEFSHVNTKVIFFSFPPPPLGQAGPQVKFLHLQGRSAGPAQESFLNSREVAVVKDESQKPRSRSGAQRRGPVWRLQASVLSSPPLPKRGLRRYPACFPPNHPHMVVRGGGLCFFNRGL